MSRLLRIHPQNPQTRLLQQAADILRQGGSIAYPTDTGYALACHIGDKKALDHIRRLRQLSEQHNLTLVCRDLSELATYARTVSNSVYRLLKSYTPGPYTFLLSASDEVPRRLRHPKRKTIGLRIPDCKISQGLLDELAEPMLSTTLILPEDDLPLCDPEEIMERIGRQLDLVIDGGYGGIEPSSVIDLVGDYPVVVRAGAGDVSAFE